MSEYNCNICNYNTKERSNLNRHNKSARHMKKVTENLDNANKLNEFQSQNLLQPKYRQSTAKVPPKYRQNSPINMDKSLRKCVNICKYCSSEFTRTDSLSKHLKACIKKHEKERLLEEQITILCTENNKYKNESEYFQAENNYHKRMLNEAGGLVQKSVSALTYAVGNYNNAPTIKMIDIYDIEGMKNNDKKLVEDVLSHYKHKTLDRYLGNSIIKLYKKDDPKAQSVWSTDTSRLTYLIKELMVNNSSNWVIDKKGIKTKEYLIDPLLKHIKELIIYYQKHSMNLSTNAIEVEFILELNKNILKLVTEIDDGIIGNNLLKYISTHLYFNEKQIK